MVTRKGLGQANILRTNNNTSTGYGVAYADEVSGHRTVANLTTLYALNDWQLSASGDNTGSDAIGQLWYVVNADGNGNGCYYQLKDWSKRNETAGWSEFKGTGASTAAAVTFDNTASGMTAVNAQDAIEELNVKKLAKADIVQEPGNSEELVMSQKAVSDKLKGLSTEIIYDVSARNDGAVFESLQALLSSSNLSTLIPTSVRHGGMSIRFVQSSDNKYVQYRLMANTFSTTVTDWQGVDDEPTTGSNNLVKSGGVADSINKLKNAGYLYAGIATPSTNPGTPDGPVFYIAPQAGAYSNFGNTEIDSTGIFTWDGTSWSFEKLDFIVNDLIVNDLTTGGERNALSAEMGKVLNEKIENKGDGVYMVTSSSLADAVAEVPIEDRKVGFVIGLPGEGASVRRYKYMGKYYTDIDWLSECTWLDLDNADKYKVYYFRLCPTIEGHVDNASINSSGEVTTGTKHVTDYIAIPESGVSIGGGWFTRYVLYDSAKNKVSTGILYGGKAFTYSTTESAFIRLEYENNTPVWLFGYTPGSSSAEAPSLPHVEVIEDFENLIDYNDNTWAGDVGPFIRLRKGETINLLMRGTDTIATDPYYMGVQAYNINQEPYGDVQSSLYKYVMPIDGYVKIGLGPYQKAMKNARYNIISKSIARTRAKKRLLVVGDSISVYTWDNTLSKDVIQGYPFFLATQGDHELSVTNQAVSGKSSGHQLTTLQNKDMSVYDAVIIFIGTNDYGYNVKIDTFKSNIAVMVDYITAQNPACKIGFLTLIHRSIAWDGAAEVPNAVSAVLSDYCTAIKEVAMTYGLPVLDLWNECQCNFNFSIYKTNYSSQESEASGDGLHPTNEAHKLFLYPLVREFVKKLLLYN